MAKPNKNQPQSDNPLQYLEAVTNAQQRQDCTALLAMMESVTGTPAVMWGDSMVGFDSYHYRYASGREGDFFITGFAPRATNISIYIMSGFEPHQELLARLGKYKLGKSCLYIKSLAEVDQEILRTLVEDSVNIMRARYH